MTVFGTVVQVATDLLAVAVSNLSHRGAIRSKAVSDDDLRSAVSLHGLLQKPERCGLIPGLGDVALQHLALVIDSSPEVVLDTVDLNENLVEVPLPLSMLAHEGSTFRADFAGEDRSETIDPEPDAFMANINSSLMEQVFDVPQQERKSNVHHHRQLDNFG